MNMEDSIRPEKTTQEREASKRRWSRKKKLFVGAAIVVSLVIAYFAVPPAYGRLKTMRADSFFEQGQKHMAQGQWTNALDRFELALQMTPDQTRYRAAIARASEKVSLEQALRSWIEIIRSPNVTTEERQDYVQFLMGLGRLDRAAEQIAVLMSRRPPEPRSLSLAAEFYRLQGDIEQALTYARGALFGAPDDDKLQLQLGSLLLSSDTPAEKEEGRKLLWELAGRENPNRVDAWRRLSNGVEMQPAQARQLLAWLDASPAATTNAILRANLVWASDSNVASRRDALVAETVRRTPVNNEASLAELVTWLNYRKAYDSTLGLLDDARMGTNIFLFTMRIEALTGLKRWNEAESLLQNTNIPVERIFRLGTAAYLKSLRGDVAAERRAWDEAIRETTNAFSRALGLANLAERIGRNDIALRAYAHFRDSTATTMAWFEANRQSYRIYMAQGDLKAAREALSRIALVQRVDDRTKSDYYYLNLLLGEQIRPTLEECLREVRVRPDRYNYKILAALAHVRQGDPAAGLQLIQNLPMDAKLLPARWRAVVMTVFRANGKVSEWTQLSETLSNSGFSNTELQLLQTIGRR